MLIGLLIGIMIGLLLGPALRSWLAWREYSEASRSARLTEDVLRRMTVSPSRERDPADETAGPVRTG